MRGLDSFAKLWRRRTVIELPDGTPCDLLSLPDLVQAKKTQHDKDWPMIRRLVEAYYFQNCGRPNPARVKFWLRELRTPQLLVELAQTHARFCRQLAPGRPLLASAVWGQAAKLEAALLAEETVERERDKLYWLPRRKELEKLMHAR
jgi:hypothetical protein